MIDNAPGTLHVYGLAMDGVTSISLRARGVTRRAVMGRNAFYLDGELARKPQRVHRDAYRALRRRDHATGPVTHRRL